MIVQQRTAVLEVSFQVIYLCLITNYLPGNKRILSKYYIPANYLSSFLFHTGINRKDHFARLGRACSCYQAKTVYNLRIIALIKHTIESIYSLSILTTPCLPESCTPEACSHIP